MYRLPQEGSGVTMNYLRKASQPPGENPQAAGIRLQLASNSGGIRIALFVVTPNDLGLFLDFQREGFR
jgi:hypothetical protein